MKTHEVKISEVVEQLLTASQEMSKPNYWQENGNLRKFAGT